LPRAQFTVLQEDGLFKFQKLVYDNQHEEDYFKSFLKNGNRKITQWKHTINYDQMFKAAEGKLLKQLTPHTAPESDSNDKNTTVSNSQFVTPEHFSNDNNNVTLSAAMLPHKAPSTLRTPVPLIR
jgi:hypothetical protein